MKFAFIQAEKATFPDPRTGSIVAACGSASMW